MKVRRLFILSGEKRRMLENMDHHIVKGMGALYEWCATSTTSHFVVLGIR